MSDSTLHQPVGRAEYLLWAGRGLKAIGVVLYLSFFVAVVAMDLWAGIVCLALAVVLVWTGEWMTERARLMYLRDVPFREIVADLIWNHRSVRYLLTVAAFVVLMYLVSEGAAVNNP